MSYFDGTSMSAYSWMMPGVDNPNFRVAALPLEDLSLHDEPEKVIHPEEVNDPTDIFKVGKIVRGKTKDGTLVVGKIIKIEKDLQTNEGTYLIVQVEDGHTHKLNPTKTTYVRKSPKIDQTMIPPATFIPAEKTYECLMSFEEFVKQL